MVRPVYIHKYLLEDMYWMIAAGLLLFIFTLISRRSSYSLKRWQSLLLILFYLLFLLNLYLKL
jgi:Ca2+/Na+ antiporter